MAPVRHKHVLREATSRPRRPFLRVGVPVGALLVLTKPAVAAVWPDQQRPVEAISMAHSDVRLRTERAPLQEVLDWADKVAVSGKTRGA